MVNLTPHPILSFEVINFSPREHFESHSMISGAMGGYMHRREGTGANLAIDSKADVSGLLLMLLLLLRVGQLAGSTGGGMLRARGERTLNIRRS